MRESLADPSLLGAFVVIVTVPLVEIEIVYVNLDGFRDVHVHRSPNSPQFVLWERQELIFAVEVNMETGVFR